MALRESRSSRRTLLLSLSSIVLGTAALVALSGLSANLERAVNEQSKALLGADLLIRGRQPFSETVESLFDSLGGEQSRQVSFTSMLLFPRSGQTRLVSVRALAGRFPYYGELVTDPPDAARDFRTSQQALVDDGLMLQFGMQMGDTIKLGERYFRIAGRLKKIAGEAVAAALVGPRVYIPLQTLEKTGLIRQGSLATYAVYFKFSPQQDVETILEPIKPVLRSERLTWRTVESARENTGRALDNLYQFLNLVGFIAILLGAVGVASAIHVYIRQKLGTIAYLHCIGADTRQTFAIYLIQAAVMGFCGAAAGALIGVALQYLLPYVLTDFLPVNLEMAFSPIPVVKGMAVGLLVAIAFTVLPLLAIRHVSPLMALRASHDIEGRPHRDSAFLLTAVGIFGLVATLACIQADDVVVGLSFVGASALVFLLLATLARGLRYVLKHYLPDSRRYVVRQAIANLYRPNNQTTTMMVAIGLGTFLLTTLFLVQHMLIGEIAATGRGNNPNLVLFDIQSDQLPEVTRIIREHGLPVLQSVPIVTMRLAAVNGEPVEKLLADTTRSRPRWVLRREYRSTYRDTLTATERLLRGHWQARVRAPEDRIFVSLESEVAANLQVDLGDELVFDVQGVPITTYVGSLREVNWRRVQPNFFIVFPEGVLETAPQFHVLVSRTNSSLESAKVQRAVVEAFPNVSIIDLTLVLEVVESILTRISYVVQFMALFSILTGLLVLAGAVVASRKQRMQESVLLRTIGAGRRQITIILVLEYAFLGFLAALAGMLLSIAASWGLGIFLFQFDAIALHPAVLLTLLIVVGLTVFLGMINSRGVTSRPPLEILRGEIS